MTRSATILFSLSVVLAAAASAQTPAGSAPASSVPAAPAAAAAPVEPPQGFNYRPEGRRDPFISLLGRGGAATAVPAGNRPAGLAGMTANEINLRGTVASPRGFLAVVLGIDNKTYIVRPGEKLLDGEIRAITADQMVIVQQVNDPLSLQKQRELRKVLRQEGAK